MSVPNIPYYALLEYDRTSKITPKYRITASAGYYPPMEELKGRDGNISMFLLKKQKEGTDIPAMRLQAKNSLNFTGLKDYYTDGGKISGYAYGYPFAEVTYSSKKKRNPFYEYRSDGYLMKISDTTTTTMDGSMIPTAIELIILECGKILIPSYFKMLQMGGFDRELAELRRLAMNNSLYNKV